MCPVCKSVTWISVHCVEWICNLVVVYIVKMAQDKKHPKTKPKEVVAEPPGIKDSDVDYDHDEDNCLQFAADGNFYFH